MRDIKKKYAALATLVELANLAPSEWPESPIIGDFEAVPESEAAQLQQEADDFTEHQVEPFRRAVRARFGEPATFMTPSGESIRYLSFQSLAKDARALRACLQLIMRATAHPAVVPIGLPMPGAAAPRLQIALDRKTGFQTVIRPLDLFQDGLLPALMVVPDIRRLRVCQHPRCDRIYVAMREDQRTCSKRCSNNLRQLEFVPTPEQKRERSKRYERNRRQYKKAGFKPREAQKLHSSVRPAGRKGKPHEPSI